MISYESSYSILIGHRIRNERIALGMTQSEFAKRTVVGSLLLSFWLAVIPYVQLMEEPDLFLTSVFGNEI